MRRSSSVLLAGLTLALVLQVVGLAAASDCVDHRDYLRYIRRLPSSVVDDISIEGNLACLADTDVEFVDLSNPALAHKVGSIDVPSSAESVLLLGTTLYVGTYSAGLHIYDVTVLASPVALGSVPLPSAANALAYDAGYVYVAVSNRGLSIVDVSDPTAPAVVGNGDTVWLALDVAVDGDTVYLADGHLFFVFDVSDRTDPTEIALGVSPNGGIGGVAVRGNLVYGAGAGLEVFDVSNPAAPAYLGGSAPGISRVSLAGDYAYGVAGADGMVSFDISVPTSPVAIGALGANGRVESVAPFGNHVLVGGFGWTRVADSSEPASPAFVGEATTPGSAWAVHVADGRAHVADGPEGFALYDVTNPASPTLDGRVDTPGQAHGVTRIGNLACVADGTKGIQLVDVSDPMLPEIVGSLDTGEANAVTTDGVWLYVADETGLVVVDVSDPVSPEVEGFVSAGPYGLRGIAVAGSYAYVGADQAGFRIADISNPQAPVFVGQIDTPSYAIGVAVDLPYAYVADQDWGLWVMDVSDPQNPVDVGFIDTPGLAYGVAVAGGIAYVADQWGGVQVVDVAVPTIPWIRGSAMKSGERAYGVAVAAGHLFCAEENLRIRPLQCTAATSVSGFPSGAALQVRAFPNPSPGAVRLGARVGKDGPASVRIFDAAGRLVRELYRGNAGAGTREWRWDGRDTAGRAVAGGVYFARIETAAGGATGRMVLLR